MNYVEDLNVEDIPEMETDTLLDSLSLEIMEESIKQQISLGLNTSRDFLSTVIDKFKAIINNTGGETSRGITDKVIDWCETLILHIVHEYDLGYNNPDEQSLDLLNVLETLYNFFVLERSENILNFFTAYIDVNKQRIIDAMGIGGKSGDITTIANKKKNISKNNIPILSNLDEVMQFIIHGMEVDSEEFLSLINDGEFYINQMIYYFDTDILCGNFVTRYVCDEIKDYSVSAGLRSSIRMYLSR